MSNRSEQPNRESRQGAAPPIDARYSIHKNLVGQSNYRQQHVVVGTTVYQSTFQPLGNHSSMDNQMMPPEDSAPNLTLRYPPPPPPQSRTDLAAPPLAPLQVPSMPSVTQHPHTRISTGYSPLTGHPSFSSSNGELPMINGGMTGGETPFSLGDSATQVNLYHSAGHWPSHDGLGQERRITKSPTVNDTSAGSSQQRPLSIARSSYHGSSRIFNSAHPTTMGASSRNLSSSSLVDSYGLPRSSSNSKASSGSNIRKSSARIDPAQMPRPEQPPNVTTVLYHTKSGSGRRNPPSSNTAFTSIDTGNCSPRVMRSTMVAPPGSQSILKQVGLPFAVLCTPFANPENGEDPVALVDYADNGAYNTSSGSAVESSSTFLPPRCTRCLGYINCGVQWAEAGNSWICNLCGMINAVPTWYYSALDGEGHRLDRSLRPELRMGSVDFAVNEDYCVRPPQEPIFVFAIDISQKAVATGVTIAAIQSTRVAVQQLRALEFEQKYQRLASRSSHCSGDGIDTNELSKFSIRVGIITFDSEIQFYAIDNSKKVSADALRIFVANALDPVAPLPVNNWLVPVAETEGLEFLLEKIPELIVSLQQGSNTSQYHSEYINNEVTDGAAYMDDSSYADKACDCCVTAAIKASQLSLESTGGRVFVFTSSHATVGIGKIEPNREKLGLYGTRDEFFLYGACSATCSHNQQMNGFSATPNGTVDASATSSTRSAVSGTASSMLAAAAALITGGDNTCSNTATSLAAKRDRSKVDGTVDGASLNTASKTNKSSQTHQQLRHSVASLADEYLKLSEECAVAMVSVNLYVCIGEENQCGSFIDTALLSDITLRTGGKMNFVVGAMTEEHNVQRLQLQVAHDIESLRASEVVIKLRTSIGLRVDKCLGPGKYSELQGELECCSIHDESTFMFSLMHDPNYGASLKEDERVHVQLAILYTSFSQQRRIRIHNLTMIASLKHQLIYRNSDIEAVVVAFAKEAVSKALSYPFLSSGSDRPFNSQLGGRDTNDPTRNARHFVENLVIDVLYNYRIHCSPESPRGQLILPESLKVLPVYMLGLLKHPALLENQQVFNNSSANVAGSTPNSLSVGPRYSSSGVSGTPPLTPTYGPALGRVWVRAHERAFELRRLLCSTLQEVINSLYPRLYNVLPLISDDSQSEEYRNETAGGEFGNSDFSIGPPPDSPIRGTSLRRNSRKALRMMASTQNPSAEVFESDQIYLLDDRSICYLYVGRTVMQSLIDELFITTNTPYGPEEYVVAQDGTQRGREFQSFLDLIRSSSAHKQALKVLWAGLNTNNPLMSKFCMRLIEDSNFGNMSYVDFLCGLHSKIQSKL